jgi:DUF218 domain
MKRIVPWTVRSAIPSVTSIKWPHVDTYKDPPSFNDYEIWKYPALSSPRLVFPELVAVLCPGNPRFENERVVLEQDDANGYLGGRVRLQAAVEVFPRTRLMILLGGSEGKVRAMRSYLMEHLPALAESRMMLVESSPDTLGNLRALAKVMESRSERRVGVLTNFYHIPRAMRLASDIISNPRISIVPLVAEAMVSDTGPFNEEHLSLRNQHEMCGLRALEEGTYRGQQVSRSKWVCNEIK